MLFLIILLYFFPHYHRNMMNWILQIHYNWEDITIVSRLVHYHKISNNNSLIKILKTSSINMCYGPFRVLRPLCHWGPIITITLIIFITISAIIAYLEVFPPTPEHLGRRIHFVVMLIWPVVVLYNYLQAVYIGPGFVPLGWTPVSV